MSSRFFKRLVLPGLLALVLFASIGGSNPEVFANNGDRGIDRAIAAQEAHTDALLGIAGVTGTAVGLGDDGEPVVLILTDQRGVSGLPKKLNGVTAVAHFTGTLSAQRNPCSGPPAQRPPECNGDVPDEPTTPQEPKAPVQASPIGVGASTGSERLTVAKDGGLWCSVGTLAGPVNDGTHTFALSNAHVYALEGSNTNGTVQTGTGGDRMLSPGRVDLSSGCGTQSEFDAAELAELSAFGKINFKGNSGNKIDAAIAMAPYEHLTLNLADGTGTVGDTPTLVSVGAGVKKLGRTTDWTSGTVIGTNVTARITYDTGRARFTGQLLIEGDSGSFSAGGDSGSLIMTENGNQPVGLLFAGSSTSTIANPIGVVLSELGVSWGLGPAPAQ